MKPNIYNRILCSLGLLLCLVLPSGADTLVISRDGEQVSIVGELLYTALDKSILFESTDGQLHVFAADRIVSIKEDAEKLPAMDHDELGESLLANLPAGFEILTTDNYVIAYKTELAFAKWIAKLYERRLIPEFEKFARSKLRYELSDASFPLAIVVFGTRAEYDAYARRELGAAPGTMVAHYSQLTNRVAMYDLTDDLGGKDRELEEVLQQKDAIPMVTTIIHEGTHQLMFNRGMQVRLADAPLWLNEGMANWFETPNLKNNSGWTNPGLVNQFRLGRMRSYLSRRPKRPGDSIATLISDDQRFNFADERTFDAYAESWALVHFLLKRKRKQMREYLKVVSAKRPGFDVDAETRLKEFTDHFGDLEKLDEKFLKYINSLKF